VHPFLLPGVDASCTFLSVPPAVLVCFRVSVLKSGSSVIVFFPLCFKII